MKRILKAIIPILVATLILGGGVWAYVALTSHGTIQIDECLSFVGDNTFSVQLYPQESTTETITIANASSLDIEVDLVETIVPDLKGVTVSYPKKITIPAGGQYDILIDIEASKSAEPGLYEITIGAER